MKYRGVELKVGNGFESELCIGIEYDNTKLTQDKVIKMIRKQIANIGDEDSAGLRNSFIIEPVLDDYILVRNYRFFDLTNIMNQLIDNLYFVYKTMSNLEHVKAFVDIQTDDWFRVDGGEYNSDSVGWNDFLENLEK